MRERGHRGQRCSCVLYTLEASYVSVRTRPPASSSLCCPYISRVLSNQVSWGRWNQRTSLVICNIYVKSWKPTPHRGRRKKTKGDLRVFIPQTLVGSTAVCVNALGGKIHTFKINPKRSNLKSQHGATCFHISSLSIQVTWTCLLSIGRYVYCSTGRS